MPKTPYNMVDETLGCSKYGVGQVKDSVSTGKHEDHRQFVYSEF